MSQCWSPRPHLCHNDNSNIYVMSLSIARWLTRKRAWQSANWERVEWHTDNRTFRATSLTVSCYPSVLDNTIKTDSQVWHPVIEEAVLSTTSSHPVSCNGLSNMDHHLGLSGRSCLLSQHLLLQRAGKDRYLARSSSKSSMLRWLSRPVS